MAFGVTTYDCGDVIEYEYNFMGKQGAKGEKRAPHKKATPDQIAKQNTANKVKTHHTAELPSMGYVADIKVSKRHEKDKQRSIG